MMVAAQKDIGNLDIKKTSLANHGPCRSAGPISNIMVAAQKIWLKPGYKNDWFS